MYHLIREIAGQYIVHASSLEGNMMKYGPVTKMIILVWLCICWTLMIMGQILRTWTDMVFFRQAHNASSCDILRKSCCRNPILELMQAQHVVCLIWYQNLDHHTTRTYIHNHGQSTQSMGNSRFLYGLAVASVHQGQVSNSTSTWPFAFAAKPWSPTWRLQQNW